MGANLVSQVLAHWTHVSDRAFRVLTRMAVTALDKPRDGKPANVYFAGRELLAMSLRSDGGTEQSRFRIVARVVAELVQQGAIERIDGGRTGHNAVYRLTLGGLDRPEESPYKGGQSSHPQGGQFSHLQGGQFDHQRVANLATPRNQEEPIEELSEERRGSATTASHPPRAIRPSQTAPVIQLFSKRPTSRADEAIAEAAARRTKAVAEHQARQAAEEIS